MGAAIALQVAAHNPRIRAVWADSPFASLRRITEEFVRRITGLPGAVLNPVLWTSISGELTEASLMFTRWIR